MSTMTDWDPWNRNLRMEPGPGPEPDTIMKLDLAKHILDIDGIAVGALIKAIQDITAT